MRVVGLVLLALLGLVPAGARAQNEVDEAFVEGHVFNRRTGVPIAGALVTLPAECPLLCAGIPIPQVVTTDENGFYSAHFFGFVRLMGEIPIEVICKTSSGEIKGSSKAVLRPGTLRRDVYLRVPERLSSCLL